MIAARVLASLGAFAAAVGVRALPWREVFEPGGVVFFGNDAWHHARRIAYGFVHFPERLGHDPYLAFPDGAQAIWAPGFDATLAALAHLLLGAPEAGASLLALERFLVWAPPVLGAATVVVAMGAAHRLFGRAEAAWTGAVLCILPAHFWYSRIGFVDHHAAVAFLSTASVALALGARDAARAGRLASAVAWAVACGFCFAAAVWTWPGAVLHVALVEFGLALALCTGANRAEAQHAAGLVAGINAIAALCLLPAAFGVASPWGAWSPLILSRFQPAAFAAIAGVTVACAALWRRDALGATAARRSATAVVVSLGVGGLGLAAIPALGEGIAEAWRWLSRDEPFQRLVGESLPLFVSDGRFSPDVAWRRFGVFVFFYPFALAALAGSARRRPERWVLFAWCAGLFVATLLQRRFFATASVGFAIVLAAALCHAWRATAGGARIGHWAVGGAAAVALIPLLLPYTDFVANEWRARRGEPLRAGSAFAAARAGVAVADWFRSATPETSGWLARDAEPEYGVLAPWHLGHILTYRGRRPTVVDNFGDDLGAGNFAWARRVFATPATEAEDALRRRRVRFVVADGDGRWLGRAAGRDSLLRALYEGDGASPALSGFRLVTETRAAAPGRPGAPARFKVFERVAGARVSGPAAPGAEIEARVEVRTARGRVVPFTVRTVASAAGSYHLRLPYATRGAPSGVRIAAAYALRCGASRVSLAVDEAAVQRGLEIVGPALCAGTLTPSRAPADEEGESEEKS